MTGTSGRIPRGPQDDHDEWMALFRTLPDREIDDLLAGRPPVTPVAAALVDLVATLRADGARHGAPPMSDALRQQIATPPPRAPEPRRRRRAVVAGLAGLAFGTAGLGIAGAQNALPAPVQDATASAADLVGIELPHHDDGEDQPGAPAEDDRGSGAGERPGNGPDGTGNQGKGPSETGNQGNGPDATGNPGKEPAGPQGPPESTPGGAVPAEPGGPGQPATPASPPPHPQGDGTSESNAGNGGGGKGNAGRGSANGDGPSTAPPAGADGRP